ncbi:I78 family peptidase inhibitor [Pseudomonas sp. SIMBA_077]
MNTLFNMKKVVVACSISLCVGSVQVSAVESESGKCNLDFAQTRILHAATPEFVESIRLRSGATVARVERPGEVYEMEYNADRLRVIVNKNNIIQHYMCG